MRLALVAALLAVLGALPTSSAHFLMPWMCLERCNGTDASIAANLRQIAQLSHLVTDVSPERYNLGPNATLVLNNLTAVEPQLLRGGFGVWPMISSFPYPPEFITWMRAVFADADRFISTAVQTCVVLYDCVLCFRAGKVYVCFTFCVGVCPSLCICLPSSVSLSLSP